MNSYSSMFNSQLLSKKRPLPFQRNKEKKVRNKKHWAPRHSEEYGNNTYLGVLMGWSLCVLGGMGLLILEGSLELALGVGHNSYPRIKRYKAPKRNWRKSQKKRALEKIKRRERRVEALCIMPHPLRHWKKLMRGTYHLIRLLSPYDPSGIYLWELGSSLVTKLVAKKEGKNP